MSTNKTEHYGLHAWVGGDDFLLSEINKNFSKLDAAITAVEGDLPANRKLRIVIGSYNGDGTGYRFIDLGDTPKAVLVMEKRAQTYICSGLAAPELPDREVSVTESGMTVTGTLNYTPGSTNGYNRNPYRYLAFFWAD